MKISFLYSQLSNYKSLYEYVSIDQILKQNNFHRTYRAKANPNLNKIVKSSKTLYFKVKSRTIPNRKYLVTVKIDPKFFITLPSNSKKLTSKKVAKLKVKVHCNCPDFLYGGFKYLAYINNYGTKKELRYPIRNNPNLKGSVCAHILPVLQNLHKYIGYLL